MRSLKLKINQKINQMKYIVKACIIALLVLNVFCSSNGQSDVQKNQKYEFPHTTVINSMDEQCFNSPEDYLIFAGKEAEEQLMNVFMPISSVQEKDVGHQIHQQFDFEYINDTRTDKLRQILKAMKPFLDRTALSYEVFLVKNDNVINGWTIPGGRIYITTGLLNFVKNDHELANVIGHEIGHNENRHTVKIVQRNAPRSIFGPELGSLFMDIYSQATVSYGQPDELEADFSGFYLAFKAGYDPEVGLEFWKRMAQNESTALFEKFFNSHPYSEIRYNCGKHHLETCKK